MPPSEWKPNKWFICTIQAIGTHVGRMILGVFICRMQLFDEKSVPSERNPRKTHDTMFSIKLRNRTWTFCIKSNAVQNCSSVIRRISDAPQSCELFERLRTRKPSKRSSGTVGLESHVNADATDRASERRRNRTWKCLVLRFRLITSRLSSPSLPSRRVASGEPEDKYVL